MLNYQSISVGSGQMEVKFLSQIIELWIIYIIYFIYTRSIGACLAPSVLHLVCRVSPTPFTYERQPQHQDHGCYELHFCELYIGIDLKIERSSSFSWQH